MDIFFLLQFTELKGIKKVVDADSTQDIFGNTKIKENNNHSFIMKISFLCGCLEPGKDGVGDYSRRLANELHIKGHQVSLMGINDRFLEEGKELEEVQGLVLAYRVKGPITRSQNRKLIEKKIEELDPEWLSLQFVPFAFQKKGLPLFLASHLKKICGGRKWHVMFHELWVGMSTTESLKQKMYGFAQKHIIKQLVDRLVPSKIHTQSHLYEKYLMQMGYIPAYLPLFSNIEVIEKSFGQVRHGGEINIAVFGSLHSGAKLEEFIEWLRSEEIKDFKFYFLGQNGSEGTKWLEVFRKNKVKYKQDGWLSEKQISKGLARCSFGITSTPYFLVEKSGTVAAMLEHNLKVVCIGRDWTPRGIRINSSDDSVFRWSNHLRIRDIYRNKNMKSVYDVSDVAQRLVLDLQKN